MCKDKPVSITPETHCITDARRYAGWGFSQPFYRQKVYETAPTLGFKSLEDFMVNFWEAWALSKGTIFRRLFDVSLM